MSDFKFEIDIFGDINSNAFFDSKKREIDRMNKKEQIELLKCFSFFRDLVKVIVRNSNNLYEFNQSMQIIIENYNNNDKKSKNQEKDFDPIDKKILSGYDIEEIKKTLRYCVRMTSIGQYVDKDFIENLLYGIDDHVESIKKIKKIIESIKK